MKRRLLLSRWGIALSATLLLASLATGVFLVNQQPTPTASELAQLEMLEKYGDLTLDEVNEMPKQDRPDLAQLQNIEMTKDPSLGYVPEGSAMRAYRQVRKQMDDFQAQAIPGVSWTERGPNDIGGRTRAIMWDPNTANKVWAGGVGGGLWYTTDITTNATVWQAVDNFWSNIAVSAIAYDPTNTNTFYVGTGEGYYNGGAIQGAGIWKTTDGGNNWSQLASTDNSNFFYVQKIGVTPTGAVLATTRNGLYRSTNGGASWTTILSNARFSDIEIASNGDVWVTEGIFSTGRVWKSTNDGVSFSDVTPTTGGERIELAIAPSDPNTVYASASFDTNIAWMRKTTNGGSSWTTVTIPNYLNQNCTQSTSDYARGQAWYDNIIAVDPSNPDEIVVGGISHHKSTNGGSSWTAISYWTGGCEPYVHADQHAIATNPNNPAQAIMGSDGGVSFSSNFWSSNSPSFSDRNNGYNVTQFYSADARNVGGDNYILTGAQDNGSLRLSSAGIGGSTEATGGDGAFSHIDQDNANYQFTAYVFTSYYRSTNNGTSFSTLISNQSYGRFINPTDYDDDSNILYAAGNNGQYIYSDPMTNASPGWFLATVPFNNAQVSAVKASPYTANRVFFGTGSGDLFRVDNAQNGSSSTVTEIGSGSFPAGYLSCVALGASDNEIIVTFSNYGSVSVWRTTNGGSSWTNVEGNLPDMPVRWALMNPANTQEVLLATEQGIWSTDNVTAGSVDWGITNNGLANVRTDMLQYRDSDGQVTVATYGRGAFTGFPFNSTPPPACDVPTGLASSNVGETSFTASWNAVSGASSYDVDVNGTVTNVTGTSYNATGLSASTTYSVAVRANCASGSSAYSAAINVTTDDPPAGCDVPTGLASSNVGETSFTASWNAVSGATSYDVEVDGNVTNTTSTSLNVTGLTASTTYSVRVRANCASGTSAYSGAINVTTDNAQTGGSTVLYTAFFESGYDGWSDPGADVTRLNNSTRAYEGSWSLRIRDNSGTSNSTLSGINTTGYDQVEFDFFFYARSYANGEYFTLSVNDGSGFQEVGRYTRGQGGFTSNNTFYQGTVTIDAANFSFGSNTQFRLETEGAANRDQIHFDQITITGIVNGSGTEIVSGQELTNTGITIFNDPEDEVGISVFPNPASEATTLSISMEEAEVVTIEVLTITGQSVFSERMSLEAGTHEQALDIAALQPGIYLVNVKSESIQGTQRLIVE
ncbi:MAG: T9SS type A sorting domain-containing protein [Bacteroidota bacterium]